MKNDGVAFIIVVGGIIGLAKMIWSYINLAYEVEDLRKKLGKDVKQHNGSWLNTLYYIYSVRGIFRKIINN
jgi:hypothetical protein